MVVRPLPITPGPGQESVWHYPRPPRVEVFTGLIEIHFAAERIARATRALRVLETSHPPTFYLPREAFLSGSLCPAAGATWCEWKGRASYFDLVVGDAVASKAAWTYLRPSPGYEVLTGAVAVMPGLVDRCTVDGEIVIPQPGGFYGGWITSAVVGPFKGGPGTLGW